MRKLLLFLACWLISIPCYGSEVTPYPECIDVSIVPVGTSFGQDERVQIEVTFTNSSLLPCTFLKWQTPFEGRVNEDFFRIVTEKGTALPYLGRKYKRGTPGADDYQVVQAGEAISTVANLDEGYDLTVPGNYSIEYLDKKKAAAKMAAKRSNTGSFTVIASGDGRVSKQVPDFTSCSSSYQTTLNTALDQAEAISRTASEDLRNTQPDQRSAAQRYLEWFGQYDLSRYQTVISHFDKIYDATANKTIEFDCSCEEPYFAYVYPNQPYRIYLCNDFWEAPVTGTDSQAGTIVHELSHFTVVANTDDHVYGQSEARNLADTNPANAITNADNHEYFAENTPPLPMFPEPWISLSEALDNTAMTFTTGGDSSFRGRNIVSVYGGDAAQSGLCGDDQYSVLQSTMGSSGTLSFYWKVSSECDFDYLEFRINGIIKERISGLTAWSQLSFPVKAGDTVEWRYTKDSSVSQNNDAGWVDKVELSGESVLITPIINLLLLD